MIPVFFHGRLVGMMPDFAVAEGLPVYSAPLPSPIRMEWGAGIDSSKPVQTETVDFEIKDRRSSDGVPGELHVKTLRGLLRIPDFLPDDEALPP